MRISLAFSLVALACATYAPRVDPTGETASSASAPVRAPASAPMRAPASPTAPPEDWARLSFGYADVVAAVTITAAPTPYLDGYRWEATPTQRWKGAQVGVSIPVFSFGTERGLTVGSSWLVAGQSIGGASPDLHALSLLPDTPANRSRLEGWQQPAWRYAPLVAVVELRDIDTKSDRYRYEVVEVLRGTLASRTLADNVWSFPKYWPPAPGKERYVLSAWSATLYPGSSVPLVWMEDLHPLADPGALATIKAEIATGPYPAVDPALVQAQRDALHTLTLAWRFFQAPLVAEVKVTDAYDEPTGCGGLHYWMAPLTWLRGTTTLAPAAKSPAPVWYGSTGSTTPYLFAGGGHCHHGAERTGTTFLAAGWHVGRPPVVALPLASASYFGGPASAPSAATLAAERSKVEGWLKASPPRLRTQALSLAALEGKEAPPPRASSGGPFAPALDLALLLHGGHEQGQWERFEVVSRVDTARPDGSVYSWIQCRQLPNPRARSGSGPSPAPETWMFAGDDLPPWPSGSRWWGLWIEDGRRDTYGHGSTSPAPWHDGKLFVEGSFISGEEEFEALQQTLRKRTDRLAP